MDEIIQRLDGGELIGLAAVVLGISTGLIIATVSLITQAWRSVRINEAQAQLKREMIAAGYSADDIERVLKAGGNRISVSGCGRTHTVESMV